MRERWCPSCRPRRGICGRHGPRPARGSPEGHNPHHALGHARGAPRSPHGGDVWRPHRGPLDGPFTCRLRATRQVEGGVWLLVGGGTRRDLGATRRLPRRRNRRRCCGPQRRRGGDEATYHAARRIGCAARPDRWRAATCRGCNAAPSWQPRRPLRAPATPRPTAAGGRWAASPAPAPPRRAPRLADAPFVLAHKGEADRRAEIAFDPTAGGDLHDARFSADDLGRLRKYVYTPHPNWGYQRAHGRGHSLWEQPGYIS